MENYSIAMKKVLMRELLFYNGKQMINLIKYGSLNKFDIYTYYAIYHLTPLNLWATKKRKGGNYFYLKVST